MFSGCMVEHHIHHNTNTTLMGLFHQMFKIIQSAISRINGAVIRHVITIIHLRRNINRRQPDSINTEFLQIIQPLRHPRQITVAITGAVLKTLRINLIDDAVLPPRDRIIHSRLLFIEKITPPGNNHWRRFAIQTGNSPRLSLRL
ncbi:Uncharacterised protein [Yersinia enterocolitica]|nr:Uncharacterised protein [Yersinia enterocolitica]